MSDKLEQQIMQQIKNGRVKLKSKYIFIAKKLGLKGGIALSILLAILFFNLVFFYMKATDNLSYLGFGSEGLEAFLESFPYLLVISLIVLLFLAGYLLTKSELIYKKPFVYFAVSLVALVMVIGGAMAYSGIPEKIEQHVFEGKGPGLIFRPFLHRAMQARAHGMAGKINEIADDYLILHTPHGVQKVDVSQLGYEDKKNLENNCFVMIVGERQADVFVARAIHKAGEDAIPMMRRGVGRLFGSKIEGCMQRCQMEMMGKRQCMERCK